MTQIRNVFRFSLVAIVWVAVFGSLLGARCFLAPTEGLACYKLNLKQPDIDLYTRLDENTVRILRTGEWRVVEAPQRKCD